VSTEDKISARLDELVDLGKKVLATRKSPAPNHMTSDFVDVQLMNQWLTSCLNLIGKIFGESSPHYLRLKEQFPNYPKYPNAQQAFGVLLSAKDDFDSGAIFDIRRLIEAEVFDDFLEQAEHLLQVGYFQPAAVVIGSVLEDGVRKLCQANDIPASEKPKLDWMNSELAKKAVYSKLIQKRITAIADLRNSAAHGKWDEFDSSDVEAMLRDVRDIMTKYFS
jgi:hypothetical protein